MITSWTRLIATIVAPVRERGLKCQTVLQSTSEMKGRSREGAWIEINLGHTHKNRQNRRSREGAWIEIGVPAAGHGTLAVAPVRERGLKCRDEAGGYAY